MLICFSKAPLVFSQLVANCGKEQNNENKEKNQRQRKRRLLFVLYYFTQMPLNINSDGNFLRFLKSNHANGQSLFYDTQYNFKTKYLIYSIIKMISMILNNYGSERCHKHHDTIPPIG